MINNKKSVWKYRWIVDEVTKACHESTQNDTIVSRLESVMLVSEHTMAKVPVSRATISYGALPSSADTYQKQYAKAAITAAAAIEAPN